MDKAIYFNPEYRIGDMVALKINNEKRLIVDGYNIHTINNAGEVETFRYSLYDTEGTGFYFKDIDLQLIERVEQC